MLTSTLPSTLTLAWSSLVPKGVNGALITILIEIWEPLLGRINYFCSTLEVHIWFAAECGAEAWKPVSLWIILLSIYKTCEGQVLELNIEEILSIITQIWQLPAKRINEDCCLPALSRENEALGKLQSCLLPLLQMEDRLYFPPAPSGPVHKAHLPRLRALWMCERQINFTV